MSDTKAAWDEVGSAFSGLGVKLKAHFEHARAESQSPSDPSNASATAAAPDAGGAADASEGTDPSSAAEDAAKKERDIKEALHRLSDALEGAFEAFGAAVRDPAMKDDVKHVGQSLGTALSATFADVSEELRKVVKRSGKDAADAPGTGSDATPGGNGASGGASGGT